MLAAEAHIVFSAVHVILQLAEGHFRLYHPKLCQMPAGVAVCIVQQSVLTTITHDVPSHVLHATTTQLEL